MSIQCPVCGEAWPDGARSACFCGFDLETRDPSRAIDRLTSEVRAGNRTWRRGLGLMVLLPLTMILVDTFAVAALWFAVQAIASAVWIVKGLAEADRAGNKLAAAKALLQLPAARVIRKPES